MKHINYPGFSILTVSALIFMAALTNAGASVAGDEHWDSQFGAAGANTWLFSSASVGRTIYAGGQMKSMGNTKANFVAGYDGTNWFPLNNGVSGIYNATFVFALASDGTNLYAGGWFTNADNSGANGIARWDGTNWYPLPGGVQSVVETIKVFGTNVYVGGVFTTNNGIAFNGIGRWDGSHWHALGTGVSGGTPVVGVVSMEYDGTNLYAGGVFNQAGGVSALNVAQWNGDSWSAMGSGLNGPVDALVRYGGYVYAGGSFTNAGLGINNLAKWDGNSWSAVGSGADGTVLSFLVDGGDLYVGGSFSQINGISASRIAKWDGATWSSLGAGAQGLGGERVASMTLDANGNLIVAGEFNQMDGTGVSDVAGWDGTHWFALGGETSHGLAPEIIGHVVGLYSDGTNLFAGGSFTEAGDKIVNGVAEWNGAAWSTLGNVVNDLLPAIRAHAFIEAGGNLYTGGNFTNLGGIAVGRMAEWDGNNWNDIGDADAQVEALAYDGTNLWVGGLFTNIGGIYSPGLAGLTLGGGWYGIGSPAGGSEYIATLAWDGTNLYVGGNFTSMGGVSATNIACYGQGSWSALGKGVNGTVNTIVVTNGILYAGGSFTTASGVAANHIASWDGRGWSALGSGLALITSGSVNSILVNGDKIYAGGSFTNSGDAFAYGVAVWNGTNWSALGSGLFNDLNNTAGSAAALAMIGNDLYVGGTFTLAGDKPAMSIARWNDQIDFYPPPHPELTRQTWSANHQFQFRLTGTSGESYILEASTDLITWTPILTNTATFFDFADPDTANFSNRFYRAVIAQ